jgi:hypothetical protein
VLSIVEEVGSPFQHKLQLHKLAEAAGQALCVGINLQQLPFQLFQLHLQYTWPYLQTAAHATTTQRLL